MVNYNKWFDGSDILYQDIIHDVVPTCYKNKFPDVKKEKSVSVVLINDAIFDTMKHRNSFDFLQNVLAQVIKFSEKCKKIAEKSWLEYKKLAHNYEKY